MDFKAFSDENFDVVNWINECFRNERSAITNRESHASNLVYKLQLFVQEINCSLEETAHQVLHNLSKTTREVEALQEEAAFMKNEILMIKDDLNRTKHVSSNAIDSLANTEKVRSRLQESCKALNSRSAAADVDSNGNSSEDSKLQLPNTHNENAFARKREHFTDTSNETIGSK